MVEKFNYDKPIIFASDDYEGELEYIRGFFAKNKKQSENNKSLNDLENLENPRGLEGSEDLENPHSLKTLQSPEESLEDLKSLQTKQTFLKRNDDDETKNNLGDDNSIYKDNSLHVGNYLNNNKNNKNNSQNNLTITQQEKTILLQSIKYNDGHIMPFIAKPEIIQSLYKKGFVRKNKETELFKATHNVIMLVEIEGDKVFDEILKND